MFFKRKSSQNSQIIKELKANWSSGFNYTPEENEIRISNIWMCGRRIYHEKVDIGQFHKRDNPVFACGHAYHNFIQEKLPNIFVAEIEVKDTFKNIKLRGHIDIPYKLKKEKKIRIIDIKTSGTINFKKYWLKNASDSSQHQTNAYSFMFKKTEIYKNMVKDGWSMDNTFSVLALDRDNFDMIEHPFDISELNYLSDLERLHFIYNNHVLKKIPPKAIPNKFFECYNCWCREKGLCKGGKIYLKNMENKKRKEKIANLEIVIESKLSRIKLLKKAKTKKTNLLKKEKIINNYFKAIESIKLEIKLLKEVK